MLTIETDDLGRLAMKFNDRGRDPLGMARYHDGTVDDQAVQEHAAGLMAGKVSIPAEALRIDMDPIARTLLRHLGADPDAVAAIASAAGGVGIRNDDDDRIAIFETADGGMGRPIDFTIHLEDGRTVYCREGLRIGRIPQTLLNAAPGMALTSIVSHPALDAMDVVVETATERAGCTFLKIRGRSPNEQAT